jgi:hypothetical protein
MAQTISLMVPAQARIEPKAFAMSMNKEALTGVRTSRFRLAAWLWLGRLTDRRAGADCMFWFEEAICRNGQTSVSAPSVGCRVEPKEPPTTGSRAGRVSFGMIMILMRFLSKRTFEVEMHLIP